MSTLRIDENLVIHGVQDVTRSNTDRFPDVALQVGGFALSSDGKILYALSSHGQPQGRVRPWLCQATE